MGEHGNPWQCSEIIKKKKLDQQDNRFLSGFRKAPKTPPKVGINFAEGTVVQRGHTLVLTGILETTQVGHLRSGI